MHQESVLIDPYIIHLGAEQTQNIKITNKTSSYLNNFFFCLYNLEKFQFSPESFSLAPYEQKFIKVSLKLKSIKAVSKEFAYLKSAQTSQRITILINNTYHSPSPKVLPEDGHEQAYTLSSRDYKQSQATAFNKIINQKQAYIARLQRQIKQNSNSKHTNIIENNLDKSVIRQLEIAESKIMMLQRQKQYLFNQNTLIHQRFQEYKNICERDFKRSQDINLHLEAKKLEVMRLHDEIRRLEEEGSQFLRNLAEKQSLGRQLELKVKELQNANIKITQEIKNDNQRRIRQLEAKIQQQKTSYQNSFRVYQGKIKQLEQLASNQVTREQLIELQKQIQRYQKILQSQKINCRELQNKYRAQQQLHHSQIIKLQLVNSQLNDKIGQLNRRNRQLQYQVERLKQQGKKGKNDMKIELNTHLQGSLEIYKKQYQIIKKNHEDLQKSYTRYQQTISDKITTLESQLKNKSKQVQLLKQNISKLIKQKQFIQEYSHNNIIKIKQENLLLLQKIANTDINKKKQKEYHEQEVKINQLTIKIENYQNDIREYQKQNHKLQSKLNKLKSKTKNQLKNINDTTVEQLKRVHDEKKQLQKRVVQLQNSLQSSQNEKTRYKSKTGMQIHSQIKNNITNQQAEGRKIGIKDQRKQLQDSRAQSNCNSNSQNVENLWQQIGQLRQLDSYIRNQQERLGRIFGLTPFQGNENGRSIFRAIKFFKQLQGKMRDAGQQMQNSQQAVKQLAFLRGRLAQLQLLKKQNKYQASNIKQRSAIDSIQLMQFVRGQMRNQFKKLHDTLKLAEEKYSLLKKKIYEEYRSRLINHLQKKQKNSIIQIQATLERFIEGLSNLSHKEAILAKQIKLKSQAKKQNLNLKQKIKELTLLLQTKKGYCSREPMRIWVPQNELDWQQNLKLQAQLLSREAQVHRLNDQLQISQQNTKSAKDQLKRAIQQLEQKNQQVLKLKKQVVQIQIACQNEIQKVLKQNQEFKKRQLSMNKIQNHKQTKSNQRDRQMNEIKKDLQNKKQIIKSLKDRQKMLEELLENCQKVQQKQKKKNSEEYQRDQLMKQLKESNRELRKQNSELKEKNKKLEQQIVRKITYINSVRGQSQEHRIRAIRKQQSQNQSLRQQIRSLKDQIRKAKQEVDKISRTKGRDLQKAKSQAQIQIKSLESIVRALLRSIRRIYVDIETILKKKGKRLNQIPNFQKMGNNPSQVNGLKVYQYFEQPLTLLESQ